MVKYDSRFGFADNASRHFQKALFTTPYTVSNGDVHSSSSIPLLLDSVRIASATFQTLTPKKNTRQFEYFKLMTDIRVYYLSYLEIEKEVNEDNFSSDWRNLLQKN